MVKVVVKTNKAPAALGPYSAGICAGNFVFTAGQIPLGHMEHPGLSRRGSFYSRNQFNRRPGNP